VPFCCKLLVVYVCQHYEYHVIREDKVGAFLGHIEKIQSISNTRAGVRCIQVYVYNTYR